MQLVQNHIRQPWQGRRGACSSRRNVHHSARGAAQANVQPDPAPTARVYVGKMPLVGMEPLAKAAGRAGQLLKQHTYTLLDLGDGQVFLCDFLPVSPTSPPTAALLLSGGSVVGTTRVQRLPRTTHSKRSRFIAHARVEQPLQEVLSFNRAWDLQLALFRNDCRHHTEALVLHLTGLPACIL